MTAVRWKESWRFSVLILAFFLMRHFTAVNSSIAGPYTPYRSSDDRYDFVDVAQQHGEMSTQSETGQTSQFYTAGDVDETFWMKELGDDFKNAIHMQVGGEERHNGIFNMSENGSAYKVQHEPIDSKIIKNETKSPTKSPGKDNSRNKVENNAEKKRYRKQKYEKKSEKLEKAIEKSVNATLQAERVQTTEENTSEQTAVDKTLNDMKHKDLQKYTTFQHIHIKYAPEHNNTDTQKTQSTQNKTLTTDQTLDQSSVVVNLPDTSKVLQLETNDVPVVVQMPPVIYHRKPSNSTDQDITQTDNTQTEGQQINTNSKTQTQRNAQSTNTQRYQGTTNDVGTQSSIDNTQYRQQTYTPMTFEQQQQQQKPYQQQYAQPLQYTNIQQPQQQQHTDYPVQIKTTKYQQSTPYNQQTQYQNQQYSPLYATSSHYQNGVSNTYHNHGVYPSAISSDPVYPTLSNTLGPTRNAKLRYMLSKPSIFTGAAATYGEYDPTQTEPGYNRGNRSNRELYQEGL